MPSQQSLACACGQVRLTTTGSAMQRSPAEPKAAPDKSATTWSRSASGMTMPWFFAPPIAWTRFPAATPRL